MFTLKTVEINIAVERVCVNSSLSFNKTFVSYLLETPKRQRFAFVQCLHSVTVWNTLCKDNKL